MHIMGLEQEYKRAMTAVHNSNFSLPTVSDVLQHLSTMLKLSKEYPRAIL